MSEKLVVLYRVMFALSLTSKFSEGDGLRKNTTSSGRISKQMNVNFNSVTEAESTWQRILPKPAISTPQPPLIKSLGTHNFTTVTKHPHHLYAYNHYHQIGNYNQQVGKTLKSTKSSLRSIKGIHLPSYSKTKKLFQHHQRVYPLSGDIQPLQSTADITNQELKCQKLFSLTRCAEGRTALPTSSQLQLHQLADVATTSSSSLTYWMSALQPKLITNTFFQNDTNSALESNKRNDDDKKSGNLRNYNDIILAKILKTLLSNRNLTLKSRQQQSQHVFTNTGTKPLKVCDKSISKATKSDSCSDAVITVADANENSSVEMFLGKILKSSQEFYNKFKDVMRHENDKNSGDNRIGGSRSDDCVDDDVDVMSSHEDVADDDNDPLAQNSTTPQELKGASAALAVATALKEINSFNITNILSSLASVDAIKSCYGHRDEGTNNSATAQLPSQLPPIMRGAKERSGLFLRHLSVKSETVPSSTNNHSPILLIARTSKRLTTLSSGRTVKKIKKKFKKFLLPLVLAYKLKFMALIPLLIGGLILLVGSTGLAGFFFALFIAVMSLKAGHHDAALIREH